MWFNSLNIEVLGCRVLHTHNYFILTGSNTFELRLQPASTYKLFSFIVLTW